VRATCRRSAGVEMSQIEAIDRREQRYGNIFRENANGAEFSYTKTLPPCGGRTSFCCLQQSKNYPMCTPYDCPISGLLLSIYKSRCIHVCTLLFCNFFYCRSR